MSDFKPSDIEPKVLVREPQYLCPNCGDDRTGKGSLIDTTTPGQAFCNELCVMEWQAKRIAELERQNDLLLNTIADDNKLLAEKDRVIALLRAVAEASAKLVTYPPGVFATFSDRGWALAQTRNAVQAAVDGGALDEDGEK